MNVSSPITDCQRGTTNDKTKGAYWHNRWWRMASGLAGPTDSVPKVYRVRVTSTDPDSGIRPGLHQRPQQLLAVREREGAAACRGRPGLPAGLRPGRHGGVRAACAVAPPAELYLSQISAAYAGKTLVTVSLWDAGDTNTLAATLSFLMPQGTGYAAHRSPTRRHGSPRAEQAVTGLGPRLPRRRCRCTMGRGRATFDGCWVRFYVPIPTTMRPSTPTGEPGPGWWKIKYTMSGSGVASDLTTWKTQIIGNPVHLVVP